MSIDVSSLLNGANGAANSAAASGSNAANKKSDKDMFMTLLVAQLKNQDPLEPQDGAAFVAQLAQFNSLDQLIGIRDSVDKLNTFLQQVQNNG